MLVSVGKMYFCSNYITYGKVVRTWTRIRLKASLQGLALPVWWQVFQLLLLPTQLKVVEVVERAPGAPPKTMPR